MQTFNEILQVIGAFAVGIAGRTLLFLVGAALLEQPREPVRRRGDPAVAPALPAIAAAVDVGDVRAVAAELLEILR